MKKIYVTKTLIKSESKTELDFENREKFGWKDWDKHDYIEIEKNYYDDGQEPIEIDTMVDLLQDMKDSGATHVNIFYSVDHHGYHIDGLHFRKSTKEEIDEYEGNIKKTKDLDLHIKELEDRIEELRKKRQK